MYTYFRYNFVTTSPWKKALTFIWTNLNPLDPRMHCVPSLVENGQVVLEKKSKIGKVYRHLTDGRQAIGKAHLSFQLSYMVCIHTNITWELEFQCVSVYESFIECCHIDRILHHEVDRWYVVKLTYFLDIWIILISMHNFWEIITNQVTSVL